MREAIRGPIPVLLTVAILVAGCAASPASLAPASSTPSVAAAQSSPTPEPTPTPESTPAPTKRTPAPPGSAKPPGPSDFYGLGNATLDLPVRAATTEGCAQGQRTKFIKGRAGKAAKIAAAIEADLDHDGAPEVVAFIDCLPPIEGDHPLRQVVAFARRADGSFATMGVVVEEVPAGDASQDDNTIEDVARMGAGAAGGIRIKVGDPATKYQDTGTSPGLYQLRTYGWNGTTFVQTAGSTSFVLPPGTFDLAVSASPMTYAKPVNGDRAGTMTVTIHNNGPATVENLSVFLALGYMPPTCADAGSRPGSTCTVGSLASGASKTVTFHHVGCDGCSLGGSLQVRVGDQKYRETPAFSFVLE